MKRRLVIFLFWSIIKSALNKNSSMTDENRLADHYEKIGWALLVRIDWAVLMRIEWELDENCQVKIGWELSGENWMRIVRWELDENCRWELDENCRWELDENCLVRIVGENCRGISENLIYYCMRIAWELDENCRWELSIIFAWALLSCGATPHIPIIGAPCSWPIKS